MSSHQPRQSRPTRQALSHPQSPFSCTFLNPAVPWRRTSRPSPATAAARPCAACLVAARPPQGSCCRTSWEAPRGSTAPLCTAICPALRAVSSVMTERCSIGGVASPSMHGVLRARRSAPLRRLTAAQHAMTSLLRRSGARDSPSRLLSARPWLLHGTPRPRGPRLATSWTLPRCRCSRS
jgi:hypothetical protein